MLMQIVILIVSAALSVIFSVRITDAVAKLHYKKVKHSMR